MTKKELRELNAELIEMLAFVRDQIEEKLDELAAVADDEESDEADEDTEEDEEE